MIMANYAVIENGIVTNTIVADSKEIAEQVIGLTCVEFTSENPAYIGLGFDGTTFEQPEITIIEETP
jgi:hypothetical protein